MGFGALYAQPFCPVKVKLCSCTATVKDMGDLTWETWMYQSWKNQSEVTVNVVLQRGNCITKKKKKRHEWWHFHFKVKNEYTAIKVNPVLASPQCYPKCKLYHLPDRCHFTTFDFVKSLDINIDLSKAEHQILSLEHFPVMWRYLLYCSSDVCCSFTNAQAHVCSCVKPSVHRVYEPNHLLRRITSSNGANWKRTLSFGIFLISVDIVFSF